MPEKTYVHVVQVSMKETFDNKYKSTLPKAVNAALTKAIDRSSRLTTDKQPTGLYLDGTLYLRNPGEKVEAELSMVLADWPKKSIFGGASSKASVEVTNPAKIDRDVDDLVKAILDDVQAKVVKEFEKRAK